MKVHFGLRLLDRATYHAYCHNYLSVNQAIELRYLFNENTLKDAFVKWMKLDYVVPAFLLSP